jgi:hypothetical protein
MIKSGPLRRYTATSISLVPGFKKTWDSGCLATHLAARHELLTYGEAVSG